MTSNWTHRNALVAYALISLAFGAGCVVLVNATVGFPNIAGVPADEVQAVVFTIISAITFIAMATPRVIEIVNQTLFSSTDELGDINRSANESFKSRVGAHFGDELVENIVSYETFCKNEHRIELRKHQFAWIMLAASGLIALIAGIVMVQILQTKPNSNGPLIAAIVSGLSALVTGILALIWRESGSNVRVARARVELLHRQRIRMLFLLGKHPPDLKLDLSKLVAEANQILAFIRIGTDQTMPPSPEDERGETGPKPLAAV